MGGSHSQQNHASSNEPRFLPYRDSKLTHALKEAFAQQVNLNVLINICDEPASSNETMSSLQFSTNCKKITNRIFIQNISTNQNMIKKSDVQDGVIEELQQELQQRTQQCAQWMAENEALKVERNTY